MEGFGSESRGVPLMMRCCDANRHGKQYYRGSDGNGRLLPGDCGSNIAAEELYRTLQFLSGRFLKLAGADVVSDSQTVDA